jgi:hypothetical protein
MVIKQVKPLPIKANNLNFNQPDLNIARYAFEMNETLYHNHNLPMN